MTGVTGVIVQCRLSSARLPRKALLPILGAPVFSWTLRAMKKVNADAYIAAVDEDSFAELAPIAASEGFECVAGPRDDVLARFCLAIQTYKLDTVVRATADNPFLFYEAASESLALFKALKPDYLTFTSLPHGCGVEIFSAAALLKANGRADASAYEREHVGPALYNHAGEYDCRFVQPPPEYAHPEWNTSIDTAADYSRAKRLARTAARLFPRTARETFAETFSAREICAAYTDPAFARPVLLVPSVKKGGGTGHLRRMAELARALDADILIRADGEDTLAETGAILDEAVIRTEDGGLRMQGTATSESLTHSSILTPHSYSLIVTDLFSMTASEAELFSSAAPLAGIDEGSEFAQTCDYLLDIIPPLQDCRNVNCFDSGFITLPKNRRAAGETQPCAPQKILVAFGGEDPAGLAVKAARAAREAFSCSVTAVVAAPDAAPETEGVSFVPPVKGLREKLHEYDLVITHYGLTAFEALHAGCAVVLAATTPLHAALAKKYGFACLAKEGLTPANLRSLIIGVRGQGAGGREGVWGRKPPGEGVAQDRGAGWRVGGDFPLPHSSLLTPHSSLAAFIRTLAEGRRYLCPVCGGRGGDAMPRVKDKTYRRCRSCGVTYLSFARGGEKIEYAESYFFDEYKKQYGKTYLEDFESIKQRGKGRAARVLGIVRRRQGEPQAPLLLDAGCAYGPFLQAASEAGFRVYGLDVSQSAADYVSGVLGFPACVSSLQDFDAVGRFGVGGFDAVTLWFVLEHFDDAGAAFRKIHSLLKPGGVFAFSAPSGAGVSARSDPRAFFEASPRDHITVWTPESARCVLRRFGFKPVKIVSTGHHPERFPLLKKFPQPARGLLFRAAGLWSRLFALGDTFEVYAVKVGGSE